LAKDSGHIHFFRAVAEAYGLKGQEVHDAYLSLLPSERAEIDVATKAEMLEEVLRRQG
jgi:pyrroloquinoline quinone (PQQ) biosynthesis protein C